MSQIFFASRALSFDTWTSRPVFVDRDPPVTEKHLSATLGHSQSGFCVCQPVIIGDHPHLLIWQHGPIGKPNGR